MILLLFYAIVFLWLKREIQNNEHYEKKIFWICCFIDIVLAVVYRAFLIDIGIEHGLANLDMQYYVSLAERVSNLSIKDGFDAISSHWNFRLANSVQIWGYRLYIYFLSFSIYHWNFLSVDASIYLISILQITIANLSSLTIFNSIKDKHIIYKNLSLLLMLIAPPIWFGCVRLLREALMYLCMALIIKHYCKKDRHWVRKLILPTLLLTIFRPYYTLFMIPLCLLLNERTKMANCFNIIILCVLTIICVLFGTSIGAVMGVVLSPNFFNQVHQLNVSAIAYAAETGQIPIVNYIGSLWNFLMIAIGTIAFFNRTERGNTICSIGLIIDVCMVYAIAYGGSTELRHKMFFVIPYILLLNSGMQMLKDRKSIVILYIFLVLFLIMYTLLILMIGR